MLSPWLGGKIAYGIGTEAAQNSSYLQQFSPFGSFEAQKILAVRYPYVDNSHNLLIVQIRKLRPTEGHTLPKVIQKVNVRVWTRTQS